MVQNKIETEQLEISQIVYILYIKPQKIAL